MANRSKTNDRGGWRLPLRRERGMRQTTHDRALGIPQENGTVKISTKAEQQQSARESEPKN